MALTYGIESLAVINKGGGLRRLAAGQTTEYLRGDMTWTAFPTTMAPSAHSHAASEIASGTLALDRIPTGTGSNQVALGNHTHNYAGSSSAGGAATTALACTGNAATATKLATARNLTIGGTAKSFDGSEALSWTLAEIGAAAASHGHSYAGSASDGGAATTALACTGNAATATKLATTRALTIGGTAKNFDGSAPVAWTLAEIGAAPTAHNHSATEITSGQLALDRIPTGTSSSTVALGNHTHLYAGSASAGGPATTALACTGNAATATKLATTRDLTIGGTAKNFDGSAPVAWTLTEIGAAPTAHTHDAGDIVTSALAVGNGGTGRQSFDINSLIMGGTQYNGSLQSLPSGLTREVLAGGGIATSPKWLSFDEYERFSVGGTAQASATQISAKSGISEKLVFIDPGAETTPQTVSYFKAPAASGQEYGDRIVIYCCSGNDTYKYIVVPSGTEKFCDLIGGQYTGNIEASYGNKIELVCLPKAGAKAWYISRIALINNN